MQHVHVSCTVSVMDFASKDFFFFKDFSVCKSTKQMPRIFSIIFIQRYTSHTAPHQTVNDDMHIIALTHVHTHSKDTMEPTHIRRTSLK